MISRRRVVTSGLALWLVPGCKSELKPPAACTDTAGLTPAELQVRTALGYVDRAEEPEKKCATCVQFEPAEKDGVCSGCKLIKGPVHPLGSCKAYAKKA